jgi:hypothetical protein
VSTRTLAALVLGFLVLSAVATALRTFAPGWLFVAFLLAVNLGALAWLWRNRPGGPSGPVR